MLDGANNTRAALALNLHRDISGYLEKEAKSKPHRIRYRLNTTYPDPAELERGVNEVCETYRQAPQRAQAGCQTESCDEMTGIQALERAAPTKLVKPELV